MKKILIVGGGTAGLFVANHLASDFDVLVLESSDKEKLPLLYRIPLAIGFLFRRNDKNYLRKIHLKFGESREIPYFLPKLIGGSSEINGAVHVIGSRKVWKKILKYFQFSLEDFEKACSQIFSNANVNRTSNYIKDRPAPIGILEKKFIGALKKISFPLIDSRWQDEIGFGKIINNCSRIFRSSVAKDFKITKRVKIVKNTKVIKLIFEGKRIVGVKSDKNTYFADFVLLSAGTIGTNEILLRTKKETGFWQNHSIGSGIKDHTNIKFNFTTPKKIGSINELLNSRFQQFVETIRHVLGQPSLLSGTGATLAIHYSSKKKENVDCRINVVRYSEYSKKGVFGQNIDPRPGFSISFTPLFPKSYGYIDLDKDSLTIRPKYLSCSQDTKVLLKAMEFVRNLIKDELFDDLELKNLDGFDFYDQDFLKNNLFTGHHLIGGVASIVEPNFSVRDISGLFICDASLLKDFPSSNIHASILILAHFFVKKFCDQHSNQNPYKRIGKNVEK